APQMVRVMSARSSTERASGPSTFMWRTARGAPGGSGICPVLGTRPSVAFRPKRPQKCAGVRTEPARSLPTSNAERPAATAAARKRRVGLARATQGGRLIERADGVQRGVMARDAREIELGQLARRAPPGANRRGQLDRAGERIHRHAGILARTDISAACARTC